MEYFLIFQIDAQALFLHGQFWKKWKDAGLKGKLKHAVFRFKN